MRPATTASRHQDPHGGSFEEASDDHLAFAANRRSDEDLERAISPAAILGGAASLVGAGVAWLFEEELPVTRDVSTNRLLKGRFASLEWTAEAADTWVADGADSFVIEDGWSVAQTSHDTVGPT